MRNIRSDKAIQKGLEFVEKALQENPGRSESIAIKGSLFLMMAKNEDDQTKQVELSEQASALLKEAFKINSFLKRDYESFLDEATQFSESKRN
jgi:hypothetical protein